MSSLILRIPLRNPRYCFGNRVGEIELEVGQRYFIYNCFVRFIQVTPKGFNFLEEKTNKCIRRRHLYPINFIGKHLPEQETRFIFRINAHWPVYRVVEQDEMKGE